MKSPSRQSLRRGLVLACTAVALAGLSLASSAWAEGLRVVIQEVDDGFNPAAVEGNRVVGTLGGEAAIWDNGTVTILRPSSSAGTAIKGSFSAGFSTISGNSTSFKVGTVEDEDNPLGTFGDERAVDVTTNGTVLATIDPGGGIKRPLIWNTDDTQSVALTTITGETDAVAINESLNFVAKKDATTESFFETGSDLTTPDATYSNFIATDINNTNRIGGNIFSGGLFVPGHLTGGVDTSPFAIPKLDVSNTEGAVAGLFDSTAVVAGGLLGNWNTDLFLYDPTENEIIDLNELSFLGAGFTSLNSITGVGRDGTFTGFGTIGGQTRPFIGKLESTFSAAIPEPGTGMLLSCVLLLLGPCWQRRTRPRAA